MAPKGYLIPLKPSYGHLPKIPSHDLLQKVWGQVAGFPRVQTGTTTKEILLFSRVVKGKIGLANTFRFRTKTDACVWTGPFSGMIPKTRVQELMLPYPSLHMLSRRVPPMAIYLMTEHLNFSGFTRSLSLSALILRSLKPLIYPSFIEISLENPLVFITHRHFSYRFNPVF